MLGGGVKGREMLLRLYSVLTCALHFDGGQGASIPIFSDTFQRIVGFLLVLLMILEDTHKLPMKIFRHITDFYRP